MADRRFHPSALLDAARAFIQIEASSGLVLLLAAVAAMVWANSPWSATYEEVWNTTVRLDLDAVVFSDTLRHWVNDGLMALFFFLVGLEIKRELVHGELSSPKRAALPALAALGGMVAPAAIYLAFNAGSDGADGWGVPMATDIAFALGVLSLLNNRVPFSLKVFLLGLAVTDDVGSMVVLAVFYTTSIDLQAVGAAAVVLFVLIVLQRKGLQNNDLLTLLGIVFWAAVYKSGIHGTLAGVALGLLTPARPAFPAAEFRPAADDLLRRYDEADVDQQQGLLSQIEELAHGTEAPVDRIERNLHPWVSFGVVPLFALANAGVSLSGDALSAVVSSPVGLGIVMGRLLGKPIGIVGFSWLAVRLGLCTLPTGATWRHVAGIGILGGIGFTVSLLIAELAFEPGSVIEEAKLAILIACVVAGALAYAVLRFTAPPRQV